MGAQAYTAEELRILRTHYADTPNRVLGEWLGRAPRAIGLKARKEGLRKSDAFIAEHGGQLKPGNTPWNKGTKGLHGQHPNSRATQFKPGNRTGRANHLYRPIGSLRISKDGYLERKVTDDHPVPARRWVGVHRLVWEAANGPIPRGHAVAFLPGQRTTIEADITLDRLELVSRAELMARNTKHRLPKELADLIAVKAAITRQINRREKRGRIPNARTSP